MASLIGNIKEFDNNDSWVEYIERMEQFFRANGINDETKKKSILLSSCGSKVYKLFRNLLAPTKPGDVGWGLLKETLIYIYVVFYHRENTISTF